MQHELMSKATPNLAKGMADSAQQNPEVVQQVTAQMMQGLS